MHPQRKAANLTLLGQPGSDSDKLAAAWTPNTKKYNQSEYENYLTAMQVS
jgi:hypothetical protein